MTGEIKRAEMRISTAEREHTIEHLQTCTSEGRLSLDEFTERVDKVYLAKTFGQLRPLVADLPASGHVAPETDIEEIALDASSERRIGKWVAARRFVLRPKDSSMVLNFTRAVIGHREVDIEIQAKFSSILLILPSDAWAEANVKSKLSSCANKAQRTGNGAGVRFHVHGELKTSSLRIRHVRRFLWWEF